MPRPSKEDTLEYFLALPYMIKMASEDERHLVFITELALMEEDEDLNAAYARLQESKRRRLTHMVEAGLQRLIPLPNVVEQRRHWAYSLKPFAVKVIVVLLLAGAAIWGVRSISMPGLVPIFETAVSKINDIPDDKIRSLRNQARRALVKLRPLIEEVQDSIVSPAPPAPPDPIPPKGKLK